MKGYQEISTRKIISIEDAYDYAISELESNAALKRELIELGYDLSNPEEVTGGFYSGNYATI